MLDPKGQAFFSEERRVKSEENRGSFASKHVNSVADPTLVSGDLKYVNDLSFFVDKTHYLIV